MKIESGIPIPPRRSGYARGSNKPKYPWQSMRVGDSFLVPGEASVQQQIAVGSAASKRAATYPGEKYVVRAVIGGVRVWRVQATPPTASADD